MSEWTREWPTEPGWYWVWGYIFDRRREREPRLRAAQVKIVGARERQAVKVIVDGVFIEQGDYVALWHPAVYPPLPRDAFEAAPVCGVCLGSGATYPGCDACGHTGRDR